MSNLPVGKYALLIRLSGKPGDYEDVEHPWQNILEDGCILIPYTHKNLDAVFQKYDHMAILRIMDEARQSEGRYLLGSWKCGSPYEVCIYDHKEDPAHDQCTYCGEPDERK